jgi:hypothetical protein
MPGPKDSVRDVDSIQRDLRAALFLWETPASKVT